MTKKYKYFVKNNPLITNFFLETNLDLNDLDINTIRESCFRNSKLTTIRLPDSIISIEKFAFHNCAKLINIYYNGTISQWNNIVLGSNWNYNVPATVVQCKDGQVSI